MTKEIKYYTFLSHETEISQSATFLNALLV